MYSCMHYWMNSENIHGLYIGDILCHVYGNITSVQLNVEYTKCCNLYCGNVEGGINWQRSCNWDDPSVKSISNFFSSVISLCLSKSSVLALFHKTEQCMCCHVIYEHSKKVLWISYEHSYIVNFCIAWIRPQGGCEAQYYYGNIVGVNFSPILVNGGTSLGPAPFLDGPGDETMVNSTCVWRHNIYKCQSDRL